MGRSEGWIVFDLTGTLCDPASLAPVLPAWVPRPEEAIERALDEAVLAAMALTHAGAYRPFGALLGAGLSRQLEAAGRAPSREEVAEVVAATAWMTPYPDAGECLERLAAAGRPLAVLTNSPTPVAETALRTARLLHRFRHVVGSDQVEAFKPDGRVYRHGLAVIGAAPGEAVMVAAHWWDLLGAGAAGMGTAWVRRRERARSPLLPPPDAEGADLAEIAKVLLGESRSDAP